MAISIISSVQSMARKLAARIRGSPSSSSDQVLCGMKKDLESLERTLRRIQAVLNDAEEREIGDDSVKLWLKELRWVAYDAENVLGEYQYEIRRAEIMISASAAETSLKRKKQPDDQVYELSSVLSQLSIPQKIRSEKALGEYQYEIQPDEITTSASATETPLKRKRQDEITTSASAAETSLKRKRQVYDSTSVLLQFSIPQRIRDILERFEEISKARKDLQLRDEDGTRRSSISYVPQHSSSLVDESDIFGREDDKEAVIQMLLSDEVGCKIVVVSIVGMGGLGKTTLAQCVYKDPRICQYFDSRGWVCVSEDFDVRRLTGEIIQSITRQSSCGGLTQLDALQTKLKEIVDGKKVLVVLDDVWNEKPSFWESLKVPFLISAATTRVLVTTRNESVAKIMQTAGNMYRLGCLPERQCWTLFCHHAFRCQNPEASYPDRLIEVGRKIMLKCGGLPLAVKTLGSLLLHYGTNEERWREVLGSEIWELDRAKDDILPALKLSYYRMPTHLKPCFLFASIYPKDFRFKRGEVIKMWMAQDYILPRGNKRLEDIGSEYFDELKRRSFFLYDDDSDCYVLHDIVHDLARHVSENEHHSIVLESNEKICPIAAEVRHLFVTCQQGVTTLCQVPLEITKDLRTLIVYNRHDVYLIVEDDQFEHSVHLRVLKVNCKRLTYSIGNLKHLCYLDWNGSNVLNDFSSLGHLYSMQTLHLHCKYEIASKFRSTCSLPFMPDAANPSQRGICYCTFSKLLDITLSIRTASWVSLLPFSQLPSLRRLRLASMTNIKRVGHENYCYCPLHLGGDDIRNSVTTNNVGFPCLEELLFENMWAWKEWSGVMDGDFPCLLKLTLINCSLNQISLLPSSLRTLHICFCSNLQSLPVNNDQVRFPYMEELIFVHMSTWEEWPGLKSGDFPRLRKLTITHCNKLRRFPLLPSSLDENLIGQQEVGFPCLEEMFLEDIPELQQEWFGVGDGYFPCLRRLTINRCQRPQGLPTLSSSSSLKIISIKSCWSLSSLTGLEELLLQDMWEWKEWSEVMDGDFPCLHKLTLRHCPSLSQIQMLPSSLKTLHIYDCTRLKSLPVNNEHVRFPYMEELVFEDMRAWEEWPGLNSGDFPCLRRLTIRDCNKLRTFPLLPSSVDENLIGQQEVGFPRLKELVLDDISELQQEWFGVDDGYFPCLCRLTINRCQQLQGLPTLSSSLKDLCIESCWSLASLTGLQNLASLESLKLKRCPNLHISPEEEPPSKLQHVKIVDCPLLQEWCNMHQFNHMQESYGLAELTIYHSNTIIKGLGVDNLTTLKRLELSVEAYHLSPDGWLPPMIQILEVRSCDYLESLSLHQNLLLLTRLEIWNCPRLAYFDGLHNLPNLEELSLAECPKLQLLPDNPLPSSLQVLSVKNCKELRSLPLLHEKLSSLEKLEVFNCPDLTIMAGLHNLSSLKTFTIRRCPSLRLSSDEQLSSMPHFLSIADCPALEEWCQQQSIRYSQENERGRRERGWNE